MKFVYVLIHIASGAYMPIEAHPTLPKCMSQLEANYDESYINWFEYEGGCMPYPKSELVEYGFWHPAAEGGLTTENN